MAQAFLFDMNGTMINDMDYHLDAWYNLLTQEMDVKMTKAEVKKEMYGKNAEVLARIFGDSRKFSDEEVEDITRRKEGIYQEVFRPHLRLIDGLGAFLEKAKAHRIKLAIGTAAPRTNVIFAVEGLHLQKDFPVIVDSEDVQLSKPDPAVFLQCAKKLGVDPASCIVFEDAPKGVEAARNGGMQAVAIKTFHTEKDFAGLDNIICFVDDYNDPALNVLFEK